MYRNFILPVCLLAGTIIGAGIFSLPYVFNESGIFVGLFYLVFFGFLIYLLHLMYADVIVRTNDHHHRFSGYAKIYLGQLAYWLSNAVVFTATILSLAIYLIISISFTRLVFPGVSPFLSLLAFWALASFTIFFKIRRAAVFTAITTLITLLIIGLVFMLGFFGDFEKAVSFSLADFKNVFLPFGPVLFSLLGLTAVPPVLVYFRQEKLPYAGIKKVFSAGVGIAAFSYILFVFGIAGLSDGAGISQDAVSGLAGSLPYFFIALIGIFGFVSLLDSYSSVAVDAEKTLEYEAKLRPFLAYSAAVLLPVGLYFAGIRDFLSAVSFVGSLLFSIWGLLTVLIWRRAVAAKEQSGEKIIGKISPALIYLLILVFIIGIGYNFIYN